MKKKQILLAVIASVLISTASQAQSMGHEYKTALGIKFLDGAGITLKHFVNDHAALEGIGFFWTQGTRITGLYELHYDINGAPGLKWYVGPGAHLGFYNTKYGNGTYAGIDGVLGLDYKINNAPLNLSLDWQPSFEFGTGRGFTGNWGGFGIRYTF
ncbi:MAG: hypothetical protein JST86_06870 [Bacteroidetes bacterium]|nr:hypothetical protein [Bacteroidota bacterium]